VVPALAPHVDARETMQLMFDEREQLRERVLVAIAPGPKEPGNRLTARGTRWSVWYRRAPRFVERFRQDTPFSRRSRIPSWGRAHRARGTALEKG
jgi:hypothetical protein